MRRTEREVTDRNEIIDVLERCDQGDTYPYVVPVSFALNYKYERLTIYFHCARQGLKIDLIDKCCNVCVETDRFIKVEKTAHGITTRYESFIGFGFCEFVDVEEEKMAALRLLIE